MASRARDSDILAAAERGYLLREKQAEVVVSFVRGRDVFVSLPTGSGKSLCYTCIPWTFDELKKTGRQPKSIIVVVSPLVALMKDQVAALIRIGVNAVYVCGQEAETDEKVVEELHEGLYQVHVHVVFFSPESLLTVEMWRDMLQTDVYRDNIVGFMVDEAHRVKKWYVDN